MAEQVQIPYVSDVTRQTAWEQMWDIDRYIRYYGTLAVRNQRKHNWLRLGLIVFATAGSLIAFTESYLWLTPILIGAMTAAYTVWDQIAAYQMRSQAASTIKRELNELSIQYRSLWNAIETYDILDSEVRRQLVALHEKETQITSRGDLQGLHTNNRLNKKCSQQAFDLIGNQVESPNAA